MAIFKWWGQFALVVARHSMIRAQGSEVEAVLSHVDEDLSWISRFASPDVSLRVCSKGGAGLRGTTEVLPNVGRESHTYLRYIVKHYADLAPMTVFAQGAEPAWGYRSGDRRSGNLTDPIYFEDYLKHFRNGQDFFFAISAATHIPRG